MELQWLGSDWDSLGRLYGVCWKRFGAKRTRQLEDGSETAELALFCKKMWFWCFGRLEDLLARASDLMWDAKLVWNVYNTCLYQIAKLCAFCKLTWFWSKSEKWPRPGLYRLAPSMHIVGVLSLIFVDVIFCKRLGAMLKRNKIA